MEQISKKRTSKFLAASYAGSSTTTIKPFEKGRIAESLTQRYDNKPTLDLTLTGAEIKAKIPNVLSTLKTYAAELQAKCQIAETSAGKPPHRQRTSYLFSQVGGVTYDYADFDTKWDEMTKSAIPRTPEQEAMYLHNRCCEEWIVIQEDIVTLRALQSTLIDEKTYNLTVSQIVSLGFGLQEEPSGVVTVEEFAKGEANIVFEFEKGGEGSKGGKVIGHTKSGKPIYQQVGNNLYASTSVAKSQGSVKYSNGESFKTNYGHFTAEEHEDVAKTLKDHYNKSYEKFQKEGKTISSHWDDYKGLADIDIDADEHRFAAMDKRKKEEAKAKKKTTSSTAPKPKTSTATESKPTHKDATEHIEQSGKHHYVDMDHEWRGKLRPGDKVQYKHKGKDYTGTISKEADEDMGQGTHYKIIRD